MSEFIYRFRWPIIIVSWLIAIGFAILIPSIEIDAEVEALVPHNMESKLNTDKIEDTFGGTDMVMILIQSDDVLKETTLYRLQKIESGFSRLPQVERVLSLFTMKDIRGTDGAMLVDPALPFIPVTQEERDSVRTMLSNNDMVMHVVVSDDFSLAALIGIIQKETDDRVLIDSVNQILARNPGPEEIILGGFPIVGQSITSNILKDVKLLLPLSILFILIILGLSFRDLKGVLLPLSVVLMSILVSLGLIPLFGWKFALVSVLLPVMMVAIGNNYGIYLVNRYHEILKRGPAVDKRSLLKELSAALTKPILLCALTTIAGVLALLTHIIVPARQVGILASIGIGWALILSLFYIPAFLAVLPKSKIRTKGNRPHITPFEHFLFRTGFLVTRKPKAILMIAGLLTAIIGIGMIRLTVEGNTIKFFDKKDPVRITSNLIDRNFGGSQTLSIQFQGDIKDPDLLKRMDQYENILKNQKGVGQVMSLASVMRLMSKTLLDPSDPGYNNIPDTREGVAQYLELYSMSGDPEDFEQLIDFNYENAQLLIRIDEASSKTILGLVRQIRELTREDPMVACIGGIGLISAEMTDSLVTGQWRSTFFAIVVVCLLVMWIFNTVKAGLLVLFPLGTACIVLFGIMGWLGIPFDPATTLITSVMIGCGVDYTVQYLWRQRSEMDSGLSRPRAIIKTLYTTGQAISFNAIAVMVGFTPLLFSAFRPIRFFGMMMVVSIFICLVGALVIVPAINLVWKPRFMEKRVIRDS